MCDSVITQGLCAVFDEGNFLRPPSASKDDSMAKGIKSFFHLAFREDKLSLLCPPCAY